MRLVYSWRALADLAEIATYYSINASQAIAQSIERRFVEVTERIHQAPESAPRVEQRIGYEWSRSFAIRSGFYRVRQDAVEILHIRHTSRRPSIPR